MSYQVLARKWRPKNFTQLMGQEHVVTVLVNALMQERLHHAYLFTGTRGVGKTTIARIFAKSLNCQEGISANPCGKCDICEDVDAGRFVDLLEIDAASRTKVDDTREILDNVQYAPSRGRYKVYLIDEVHMLSKSSFNALLKTLEEPPPHVKFILATTDPQKLPVTVLSRCLQFHLKALTSQQIEDKLSEILTAEKVTHEPGGWNIEEQMSAVQLKSYFNDLVVYKDLAFGFSGPFVECVDIVQGGRKWKSRRYGGQLILLADQELLLVLSEKGELVLIKATPDKFTELARMPAIEGKTWNHPVVVGDILLVRNSLEMVAFRL